MNFVRQVTCAGLPTIGGGFDRGDKVRVNCDTIAKSQVNGTQHNLSVAKNRIQLRKGMVGIVKAISGYNNKFYCDVVIIFGAGRNEEKKRVSILNTSLDKL